PFNQMHEIGLTHRNGDIQPNACVLIMNNQPKGNYIYNLFAQVCMPCHGAPDKYSVEFVLSNKDRAYLIEGHRYQIDRLLFKANFGDIYVARDVVSQKEVVIKVLKEDDDGEDQEYQKMRSKGSHPNVARFYGCAEIMDKRWLVIEYIP